MEIVVTQHHFQHRMKRFDHKSTSFEGVSFFGATSRALYLVAIASNSVVKSPDSQRQVLATFRKRHSHVKFSFDSTFSQQSPGQPTHQGQVHRDRLKAKVAHAVITECLDQTQTNGFTTRDIFEAVAEIKAAYESPNALGTCLGAGIKGTGMGLHGKAGAFARCRENAALAASCLSDEAFGNLAVELDYEEPEGLAEAIAALPAI